MSAGRVSEADVPHVHAMSRNAGRQTNTVLVLCRCRRMENTCPLVQITACFQAQQLPAVILRGASRMTYPVHNLFFRPTRWRVSGSGLSRNRRSTKHYRLVRADSCSQTLNHCPDIIWNISELLRNGFFYLVSPVIGNPRVVGSKMPFLDVQFFRVQLRESA